MNKSLFSIILVGSVIAAIVCGVVTGGVPRSWEWQYFGLTIVWGEIGLALAMLVTYPVLRRIDLVVQFLLGDGSSSGCSARFPPPAIAISSCLFAARRSSRRRISRRCPRASR